MQQRHTPIEPLSPLAHSPEQAAQRLGISRRAVYERIASGEIRSYKDGRRRLIPETELQRFVAKKLKQAA
jgi:excisionase family DNA binding protein